MYLKRIILILGLLFFFPLLAEAQRAAQSISSDTIGTGDVFTYSIRITDTEHFSETIYPDTSVFQDHFILRKQESHSISGGDSLVYHLQLFDVDIAQLPEMQLAFVRGRDTLRMIIPPAGFTYKSRVEDDRADLQPLKPLFTFLYNNRILYLSLFIALLVILALLYFFRERLFGRTVTEEVKIIPVPPFRNPINDLKKELLEIESMLQANPFDLKTFYSRLSIVFRDYYERVHGFPALESTTSEVVEQLKRKAFDKEAILLTAHILQEADLVKFARYMPSRNACLTIIKHAKNLAGKVSAKDLYRVGELRQAHELAHKEQQSN
ncbi:hypothetical protein QLX67_04590 [Balneolaceae bacterium ANBcel3]|nr:hypothetical protein [Balneolaceae bacterium ANBcel3]